MRKIVVLLGACIVSAGCSTPESVESAGTSAWDVTFQDGKPVSVKIRDGKEKADVRFKVDMTTGKAEYSATDVRAFDGQEFAAQLGAIQANEQGQTIRDIAPQAIPAIVDLVREALQ